MVFNIVVIFTNIVTFPGYGTPDFEKWSKEIDLPTTYMVFLMWVIFTLLTIVITVYAVYKIVVTFKKLQLSEPTLKMNQPIMIVHCLLLALTLATCIGITI